MPRIAQIDNQEDQLSAVADAVECLQSGQLVALPGSTGYVVVASAEQPGAVSRLRELSSRPLRLAVASRQQFEEQVPKQTDRIRSLTRRCWPGPLVLQTSETAELTLAAEVCSAIADAGYHQFTVPASPILQSVLQDLGHAVVVSTDRHSDGTLTRMQQAIEAFPGEELSLAIDGGDPTYPSASSVVRFDESGLEVVFSGILSDQAILLSACRIYLFVCTGNTCRSPLAEGLFRNLLAERLECRADELIQRGFLVQSAGLAAAAGSRASYESVELLRQRDIDIADHSSQPLSEPLLSASDHVFTMTASHRDAIIRFQADLADKVEVLRRDGLDVVDPIGGGIAEYQRCEREIEESLRAILDSHFN